MKGQQGQGQQGGSDELYIAGFFIFGSIFVWWRFSTEIAAAYIKLKIYELEVVELVLDQLSLFLPFVTQPGR